MSTQIAEAAKSGAESANFFALQTAFEVSIGSLKKGRW